MLKLTNNHEAIAATMLAMAMLGAVLLTDSVAIRMVLALPLVCFTTGHLVLRVLRIELPALEHTVTAICVSMALSVLFCFVIYGVAELTPIPWAETYLMFVTAMSAVIAVRSLRSVDISWRFWQHDGFRWVHIAVVILALILGVSAYRMAIFDEATVRQFWYTELWLVPTKPGKFILGVRNDETDAKTYDVSVTTADGVIAEIHGLTLNPKEVWTRQIVSQEKADAVLYLVKDNGHVRYRHVTALPASTVRR